MRQMDRFSSPQTHTESLPRRAIPAWLLSLAVHLAAMLVGSLVVQSQGLPQAAGEPNRVGAIVLARHSSSERTEYFTEDDLLSSSVAASPTTVPSDALAAVEPPASSETIKLPESPGVFSSGSELALTPVPSSGRGAPRLPSGLDEAAIRAEDSRRRGPKRASGPTAQLSLFGSADAEGWSFVFLIDRSQSMGGEGLGAIQRAATELAASIDRLTDAQMFQVIAYNQRPQYFTKRELVPATANNKQKMLQFVKDLPAFGATEHELGLLAALRLEPDVIFVFTDGGDPFLNNGQLQTIREASAGRTSIHVLHFGAGPARDNKFLLRLAGENRGSYAYIDVNEK